MKRELLHRTYTNIIYFLFGLFCCSTLSTFLSLSFGLPFGAPELFALFFIPTFLGRYYADFFSIFKLKETYILVLLLLLLLCLGLLSADNRYSYNVFGTFRSYLYMLLFLLYSYKSEKINLNSLFIISAGSFIGGFISGLFHSSNLEDAGMMYTNFIAGGIFLSYPIIKKNYKLFFLCLLVTVLVLFFSGLRRLIVEVSICLIVATLLTLIIQKEKRILIISFIVGLLMIPIINFADKYLEENYLFYWQRIFQKTQQSMDGEVDVDRANNLKEVIFHLERNILPKGLYPRGVFFERSSIESGHTLDFPLFEPIYTFGGFFAILIGMYFLYILLKNFLLLLRIKDKDKQTELILLISVTFSLIIAFFIDGSFLQYTFVVPFTGFIMGRMIKYSQLKKRDKKNEYR